MNLDPEAPGCRRTGGGKSGVTSSLSCMREDGNSAGLASLPYFFLFWGEDCG
jgi:hypothetical protein